MLAKVISGAYIGLSSVPVEVEADVASEGLPSFSIVGLADRAVEESKERVRSAIKNSGGKFPRHRITINLAPADLPKVGPSYDLPIALGILAGEGQIPKNLGDSLFFGELSLDGNLRSTSGILPIVRLAKEKGCKKIYLPKVNEKEASVISGVEVFPVDTLLNLVRHLNGLITLPKLRPVKVDQILKTSQSDFDFSEIVGQESAKRALEIAASGGHNVFMKGTPGSGKTMLARALPGILPRFTEEEALEVSTIYSITGNLTREEKFVSSRQFRSPHHTTSRIGLIGGGSNPLPGEVSLAHRGVLFLDEFPEFPRSVLEALRQPMEDGVVTISRAKSTVTYPAKFMFIAAANPCPCGYYDDPKKTCTCLPGHISRYQKRISGPILDRIDIHINVPPVETQKLLMKAKNDSETSREIQKRVQKARNTQIERFKGTKIRSNADMTTKDVKKYCSLSQPCLDILRAGINNMNLSARSYFKVIKVARTIADLDDKKDILEIHLAEALQYRTRIEYE